MLAFWASVCVDSLVDGAFPIRIDPRTFHVPVHDENEVLLRVDSMTVPRRFCRLNEAIEYTERS